MNRDDFFITEENGHRHYAAEVDRVRRNGAVRWTLATVAVAAFIAANVWHRYILGDNVLAYVVVYGGLGYSIWRIVHARALVTEFERQWLYYRRDAAQAETYSKEQDTPPVPQPTGYQNDERGI
jgi:hypothetical protein